MIILYVIGFLITAVVIYRETEETELAAMGGIIWPAVLLFKLFELFLCLISDLIDRMIYLYKDWKYRKEINEKT